MFSFSALIVFKINLKMGVSEEKEAVVKFLIATRVDIQGKLTLANVGQWPIH